MQDRMVVGDQPGVTRDAVAVQFQDERFPRHRFNIVDTAGLRVVKRAFWPAQSPLRMGHYFQSSIILILIDVFVPLKLE